MAVDDEYEGAGSQDADSNSDSEVDVPETKVLLVSDTELEGMRWCLSRSLCGLKRAVVARR
jgi:hypothetical protein